MGLHSWVTGKKKMFYLLFILQSYHRFCLLHIYLCMCIIGVCLTNTLSRLTYSIFYCQRQNAAAPPLPPKEPTFTCPICMGPLVEEMSTKCGHIFCKTCIRSAIAAQAKCPTCRKKVTVKELIRVFLPATS